MKTVYQADNEVRGISGATIHENIARQASCYRVGVFAVGQHQLALALAAQAERRTDEIIGDFDQIVRCLGQTAIDGVTDQQVAELLAESERLVSQSPQAAESPVLVGS